MCIVHKVTTHLYSSLHTFIWYKYLLWVFFIFFFLVFCLVAWSLFSCIFHLVLLPVFPLNPPRFGRAKCTSIFDFRTQEMKNNGKKGTSHRRANQIPYAALEQKIIIIIQGKTNEASAEWERGSESVCASKRDLCVF